MHIGRYDYVTDYDMKLLIFVAAFPLFGNQMYERLGYQWASSLLAFLTVAMMPFPWMFFRYGKALRKRSRFAVES